MTIDLAAAIGFRHLSVTTGAETAGDTGNGAFFVAAPTPLIAVITSVAPSSGFLGQSGLGLTITGQNTHFAQGTTVLSFSNSGIAVANLTVNSATSASATITIATTASLGFSDVLMTTVGEGAALNSGFQVLLGTCVGDGCCVTLPTDPENGTYEPCVTWVRVLRAPANL